MADEVRIWCDKCGDRIYEQRTNLVAKTGRLRHRDGGFDLCLPCSEGVFDWFGPITTGKGPNLPMDQSPKEPPPPGDPEWAAMMARAMEDRKQAS